MTFAIVLISLALMLTRPRGVGEVVPIGIGAVLLVLLGEIGPALAVEAVGRGFDVYLFLIGMMLLAVLAEQAGVFRWVSALAIRHARGSRTRLFGLVYMAGVLVTAFLSNDATAVVLTPAVLSTVKRSKLPPLPYLFSCAMVANAASFILPISNPANLVVFGDAMPKLSDWLAAFALPSLLSVAVTYGLLRWWFREDLRGEIGGQEEETGLSGAGKLVLVGLSLVVALLLFTSATGRELGPPTCLAALVVAAVFCLIDRRHPVPLLREVSWSSLLLVAGLFVMVTALEHQGVLNYSLAALRWAQSLPESLAVFVAGGAVGVANNLVNNLPLGLIVGNTLAQAQASGPVAHAILIGVDLGPNLSTTGSLATILWLIALRREGLDVSFLDFLKLGAVLMPLAIVAALSGLLLTT